MVQGSVNGVNTALATVPGLLLILLGACLRWQWVRNRWFRVAHLLAIVIVAFEAINNIECPLTTWEYDLRRLAGQDVTGAAEHLHAVVRVAGGVRRGRPRPLVERVRGHEAGAAQGLHLHQVEVGGHHQVPDELAVLLHADRADGDLRVPVHVVEQADAQVAGEALVDQLHRRHAAADDALLPSQVVGLDAAAVLLLRRLVGLAGDALQQGVDLFLGKKVLAHATG